MVSMRISPELEKKLNAIAASENKSRSEIIKESINEYIKKYEAKLTAYELGKDLFGKAYSSQNTLSQDRKKLLSEKLKSKHEKRQSID